MKDLALLLQIWEAWSWVMVMGHMGSMGHGHGSFLENDIHIVSEHCASLGTNKTILPLFGAGAVCMLLSRIAPDPIHNMNPQLKNSIVQHYYLVWCN